MANRDRKQFPKSEGKAQPAPSAENKVKDRSPDVESAQLKTPITGAKKSP